MRHCKHLKSSTYTMVILDCKFVQSHIFVNAMMLVKCVNLHACKSIVNVMGKSADVFAKLYLQAEKISRDIDCAYIST